MPEPVYRITDGWVVFIATDQLKIINAAGRSWSVQTPGYEAARVAALLDGAPCETDADHRLLDAVAELGAVQAVREPELEASTFEMLVARHTPRATLQVMRANGFEPKDAATSVVAPTFSVFAQSWLDQIILDANRVVIETGRRVVPVVTSGSVVGVGPVVDPAIGGPCLRCLHERVSAALIASNRWAMSMETPVVRVGSVAPLPSALQFAVALAHDFLVEVTAAKPVDDRYRTVRRFDLRDATADRLVCHPVAWCADCGRPPEEERPFADHIEPETLPGG